MYTRVNFADFQGAFEAQNRQDKFSYDALEALFNHLEDSDFDYNLDVVQLCCDYAEDSVSDIAEIYDLDNNSLEDVQHFLECHNVFYVYIEEENTILYENF